jgi:hypothetical protein
VALETLSVEEVTRIHFIVCADFAGAGGRAGPRAVLSA